MTSGLAMDGGTPSLGDQFASLRPSPLGNRGRRTEGRAGRALRRSRQSSSTRRTAGGAANAPVGANGRDRSRERLERRWVDVAGREHALAVRSGALAARLAMRSIGVGPSDEVLFPAGSYFTNPAITNGATAIPIDLDPYTLQLDPRAVEAAIGRKTVAIVVLDSFGATPDYGALLDVANRNNVALIEEATGAVGATFRTLPAGSFGAVSFCALGRSDRASANGEGGIYSTNNREFCNAARRQLANDGGPVGLHYRPFMSDTVSNHQLDEEVAFNADQQLATDERLASARFTNGSKLAKMLAEIPGIRTPIVQSGVRSVFTTFPILVQVDELGLPQHAAPVVRDALRDCARAEGLWLDTWGPEPIGGYDVEDVAQRSSVTTELDVFISRRREHPVAEELAETCVVVGRGSNPFDSTRNHQAMEAIAGCLHKILVTNTDRFRAIVNDRLDLVAGR